MAEQTFSSGEIIFRRGDPSKAAYVITSGHVEIIKGFPENPVILAHLVPGDIFGEMGLMDERPRSLTAWAADEVQVITLTRDEFVDMLGHQPQESIKYVRVLFERLQAMNAQVGTDSNPAGPGSAHPPRVRVTILPLSRSARRVVPKSGIVVNYFPFRVGRALSPDDEDPLDNNDLSIPDRSPFNVSKDHFSIDQTQTGVALTDRGSYLGTIVNGELVGGHRTEAQTILAPGENEIIVGSSHSPFRFRVLVDPEQ